MLHFQIQYMSKIYITHFVRKWRVYLKVQEQAHMLLYRSPLLLYTLSNTASKIFRKKNEVHSYRGLAMTHVYIHKLRDALTSIVEM